MQHSHFSRSIRTPQRSAGMNVSEPPSNPSAFNLSVVHWPRKTTGMMVSFVSYFMASDDTFIGFCSRSEGKRSSSFVSDMGDKDYSDPMNSGMTDPALART
jgi:hypothetical protein